MKWLAPLFAAALVTGCDFTVVEVPPPAPVAAPDFTVLPASSGADVRWGTVHYTLLESDCPEDTQSTWTGSSWGNAVVEDGVVEIEFPNMPALRGELKDGAASLRGSLVFSGATGADVTCTVNGSAALDADGAEGEMTERLSSEGDLNCTSTAGFVLVFEE